MKSNREKLSKSNRTTIVFPGQHVITSDGKVAIVAYQDGQVYVYGSNGLPVKATVCTDAWGGEHDQSIGLAA